MNDRKYKTKRVKTQSAMFFRPNPHGDILTKVEVDSRTPSLIQLHVGKAMVLIKKDDIDKLIPLLLEAKDFDP